MEVTVANYIAQSLKEQCVDYFFVLTGGDQALWIALAEAGVTPVLSRSEASAVYMADGYARRSGKVGLVYGQAGPGTANAAAALADPYWAGSAVLLITSFTSTASHYRSEYQELATDGMLAPVTVADYRLPDPGRILDLLPLSMATATAQGPVSISVPRNWFTEVVTPSNALARRTRPDLPIEAPWPSPDAVQRVAEALDAAERPLVLIGSGGHGCAARQPLVRLAGDAHIPVVSTVGGKGVYDEYDARWVGVVGKYAGIASNRVAARADLILALGTGLGGLETDGYSLFAEDATVIQVDAAEAAIGKGYPPDLGICADLSKFLQALTAGAAPMVRHESWAAEVEAEVAAWQAEVAEAPDAGPSGALSPYPVFKALNDHADQITVVADTGYMAAWSSVLYRPKSDDRTYLRANGSLGWAFPAALGAAMHPDHRRTVCIVGDGGFGYHVGDLETAARLDLPVTVVILNNNCLAFEYHSQRHKWGDQVVPAVNDFLDVDHAAVAQAYGVDAVRVTTADAFQRAFTAALGQSGPFVIDVVIDRDVIAPITNFDAVMDRRV